MNIAALRRHKQQMASAQADWDNQAPKEVIDDEENEDE